MDLGVAPGASRAHIPVEAGSTPAPPTTFLLDSLSTLCYVARMRRFIEWLRCDWQGLVGLLVFVGVYALAVVFQW